MKAAGPNAAGPNATRRAGIAGLAGLTAVLLISPLLAARQPEPRKITVVAKKYKFEPNHIELKAGQPVEITFESLDVKHGFSCKDLKLEKVLFTKDSPGKLTFTPDTPGTYKFKCARWCGFGHPKMKGEIVVNP